MGAGDTAVKHRYGLLGYPLGHSFSPAYFKEKFEREGLADTHSYELFSLPFEQVPALLAREDIQGLNVTIPYKQKLWPYLAGVSEAAKAVGAVNVLKRKEGAWWGENTDVIGFERSLCQWLGRKGFSSAVVLGNGGASAAVQYVLGKLGIEFDVVVRTPRRTPPPAKSGDELVAVATSSARKIMTYEQWHQAGGFRPYGLCVQTTPVGMFPDVNGELPLPYDSLGAASALASSSSSPDRLANSGAEASEQAAAQLASPLYFYDVVYNPEPTAMMRRLSAMGVIVKGGLDMLHLQAEAAWEIWQS